VGIIAILPTASWTCALSYSLQLSVVSKLKLVLHTSISTPSSPHFILRMITNAPLYVTNQTLHDDLKVLFIKDVIQEKSINHHDKLGNHSNPILQPLLKQQQRRRLKKLWPADLTDG
jgi:hypothetical protein